MSGAAYDVGLVQRRTLGVLSAAQVLGGLGTGVGVTVGGLLAASIAGWEGAAGIASTASVIGAAVFALPLVRRTERHGRRAGLTAGTLLAVAGSAVVVAGARWNLLVLVMAGILLVGAASATGLQARYAATDLALPEHRARDLSIVVWATTIGAVAGPTLADPAGRVALSLGLPELVGGFLLSLLAFGLAALVLGVFLRPDPLLVARSERDADAAVQTHRPSLRASLQVVRASPGAVLGLTAIAVAHTTMVSVMVMTPIHMQHVDVSLVVIGLVISVHILGMYAFSPLVGMAADRWGRRPVIAAGAVILLAACLVAGTAPDHDSWRLGLGLFLLGLGWSCGMVAGSTLLTDSVPAVERPGVQGASDLLMNVCGAVGGTVAGLVVAATSYGVLTAIAAVPVLLLLTAVATTRARVRTP